MLQKIYISSFKNQLRKKNTKMTPKCSKTYPKRRPKINKKVDKIEVQKFIEKKKNREGIQIGGRGSSA